MKKKVRKRNHSQATSAKRRVAYSLAAGAATAAVGVSSSPADAAIQYSGLYNISLINGLGALPLDLDDFGATPDINLESYNFGGVPYMGAFVKYYPGKLVTSTTTYPYYVSALKPGDPINASTVSTALKPYYGILASALNPDDEFENVSNAFIGLAFPDFGPTYYGWIRVAIDRAAATFVVKDWAYEDSGAGILAGDTGNGFVPEPGTLGMLAAGSLGLLALRRRQRKVA